MFSRQSRRDEPREASNYTPDAARAEDLPGRAVGEALEVLESQVATEETGTAATTLARLVLSAVTGGTPTDDEAVRLRAIAILHFARFYPPGRQVVGQVRWGVVRGDSSLGG